MPRKQKTNLSDVDSNKIILNEIYKDAFTVKNTSLNILKNISKNIDYEITFLLEVKNSFLSVIDSVYYAIGLFTARKNRCCI